MIAVKFSTVCSQAENSNKLQGLFYKLKLQYTVTQNIQTYASVTALKIAFTFNIKNMKK
jgi:hypothetical protein